MPAVSKSQQRFMGMVHAYQKGSFHGRPSKHIRDAAKSMSPTDVGHFAETKHEGLPDHVKAAFMRGFFNELEKVSAFGVESGIKETVLPQLQSMSGQVKGIDELIRHIAASAQTGAGIGFGSLAGAGIGGGLGYLHGRSKQNGDRDGILGALLGAPLGGLAGRYGAQQLMK